MSQSTVAKAAKQAHPTSTSSTSLEPRRYFGTDGIRGRVGESCINPEFVLKLGWATGMALKNGDGNKILIGKDTRISGYLLESVLEAGLSCAGVDTHLLGPMPTPAIAYLTRTLRAKAGIVISASHNPYYDNGIKFFSEDGTKLRDSAEEAIEHYLHQPMKIVDAAELGKAKRVNDAQGRYIEFCKSTLGFSRNLKGLKIVVDCANGATYKVAPAVFSELGAEVVEIATDPDGFNINENCGSTSPELLAKIVLAEEADLGIALDGDGDRVIMVDHKGEIVNGDELVFIIAKHGFARGTLTGGVVGTVMSNFGLEIALRDLGIDFKRTKVGDRHVIAALKANDWLLGGESSGHIAHLGLTTTGDGIVSALQVLAAMRDQGSSLYELKSSMPHMPQVLINVKSNQVIDLDRNPLVKEEILRVEEKLGKSGRVLIRASGTEPVIRVMVEGADQKLVHQYATELASVIKKCIIAPR
jgi:phosphoglucosamine mutase